MVKTTFGEDISIMQAKISYEHDDCPLTRLAAAIPSDYRLVPASIPIKNEHITAYFSIPHALSNLEVDKIFETVNGSIYAATVRSVRHPSASTLFQIAFKDQPMHGLLATPDSKIDSYRVDEKQQTVVLRLIGVTPTELMQRMGKGVHIISQEYTVTALESEFSPVNEAEARVLRYLTSQGFFSLPTRGITLQQAAQELGISDSTLSLQLRSITGRVLGDYLRKVQENTG